MVATRAALSLLSYLLVALGGFLVLSIALDLTSATVEQAVGLVLCGLVIDLYGRIADMTRDLRYVRIERAAFERALSDAARQLREDGHEEPPSV